MGNMSYCRFENTAADLEDCIDALCENNWDLGDMINNASSKQEGYAVKRLVTLCMDVAENFTDDFESDLNI